VRNKIIESFEAFNKENLEYLMLHKKTYIKNLNRDQKEGEIFNKIKNYDISKFKYEEKSYGIFIYPDVEFLHLIKQLDNTVDDKLFFYITVSGENNQIDFTEGIPEFLKGLSIGYKIYKLVISKVGWVTSDRYSSKHAYNLWYNLLQDEDLYCFTSSMMSGLISKKLDDNKLKEIVSKIKNNSLEIEFDDELKEKIKSFS